MILVEVDLIVGGNVKVVSQQRFNDVDQARAVFEQTEKETDDHWIVIYSLLNPFSDFIIK